jgi:mercuric ion transport protein
MRVLTRLRAGDLVSRADGKLQAADGMLAAGGIVAALGASSCCVLPFVLFTLGVSRAWVGNVTALAPYQPLFLAAAVGLLAIGYVRVYRQPKLGCAKGSSCGRPAAARVTWIGLRS